jgi:hypothetical protein
VKLTTSENVRDSVPRISQNRSFIRSGAGDSADTMFTRLDTLQRRLRRPDE